MATRTSRLVRTLTFGGVIGLFCTTGSMIGAGISTGATVAHYDTAGLVLIDQARAAEGVGPMSLPTDYGQLSGAVQGLVVTNLERVDRGLAPFTGLSSTLDAEADQGALVGTDPPLANYDSDGIWAGTADPILADYVWMYNDGPGGGNIDCTPTDTSGCYGHRDAILYPFPGPLILGSAIEGNNDAQVLASADPVDHANVYTWAQVTPFLPVGVSATSVSLTTPTGSTAPMSTTLSAWASGEAMSISASIAGSGWRVSPPSCALSAGGECTLTLLYTPVAGETSNATLSLTGPNGPVDVNLTGIMTPVPSTTTTVPGTTTTVPSTTTTVLDTTPRLSAPVLHSTVGSAGSISAAWATPSSDAGLVRGWEYETSVNGGAWSRPAAEEGVRNTASLKGAGNATSEALRVRMTGGGKVSDWSNAVSFYAPAAPTNLRANVVKARVGQVAVTWAPGTNGGSPIIAYRVVAGNGRTCTAEATQRSCVLSGGRSLLKSGIRIQALNTVGRGAWSRTALVH